MAAALAAARVYTSVRASDCKAGAAEACLLSRQGDTWAATGSDPSRALYGACRRKVARLAGFLGTTQFLLRGPCIEHAENGHHPP
jgi:hypothetical protein